jgi:hypothetical protein
MLVVAAPFYYAAAYLGDAVVGDVIRSVTALACLLPLSWAAAAWMCRDGFWRPVGAILALTAALGLPAATYLAAEVLKPAWADWLWQFAPATFLWDAAASRQDLLFPRPLWPAAAWLATGAAMLLVMTLARDQATGNGQRATGNNKE